MDSDRVAVARAAYSCLNEADVDGLLELLDPDVEYPDVVHDTTLHGKDAVDRHWRELLLRGDHSALPSEFFELGEAVVVVAYHQAYEKDGAPFGPGVAAVHRLTFRHNRIARIEFSALDEIPEQVLARLR